ncbi:hypothetical protein [uncultured Novosphingobium sp.]|uniref:hypothetical protein n=1 Tax=uncultured Novosphingobium sp. TaxID=292277 RepID=UPI0025897E70|nr:hypothetical protein [uncultured Novosphingobium sp.]
MSAQVLGFDALVRRLQARAVRLAQARRSTRRPNGRHEARWRDARWLWPLFAKG